MKRDELIRTKIFTKIQDYNTKGIDSNIYHISRITECSPELGLNQEDAYLIYLDEKFYFVTFNGYNGLYHIIKEERAIKMYFNTKDFDEEVWAEFTKIK